MMATVKVSRVSRVQIRVDVSAHYLESMWCQCFKSLEYLEKINSQCRCHNHWVKIGVEKEQWGVVKANE